MVGGVCLCAEGCAVIGRWAWVQRGGEVLEVVAAWTLSDVGVG